MSDERVYIYVIATLVDGLPAAPVKIGISQNVPARLRELQTGSPRRLMVVLTLMTDARRLARSVEVAAHDICGDAALEGEWFDVPPEHATGVVLAEYLYQVAGHAPIAMRPSDRRELQ